MLVDIEGMRSTGAPSCRGVPWRCQERRGWVLAVLSVSLALAAMDTTALNVALPSIERDLHASTGELQWIMDAYVLVYGSLLLTAGRIADLWVPRTPSAQLRRPSGTRGRGHPDDRLFVAWRRQRRRWREVSHRRWRAVVG